MDQQDERCTCSQCEAWEYAWSEATRDQWGNPTMTYAQLQARLSEAGGVSPRPLAHR